MMYCVKLVPCMLLAGSLLMSGSHSLAQHRHSASSRSELSSLDKDYLKDTAQSNLEEIQFAPTVQQIGNSADRQFAQHMKTDHARANAQLKALAARVGYALPKDASEEQHAIMERLGKMQGAKFYAAYKQEMIRDHTSDIAETQREISLGRNPLVKASAEKNLLLLQMHLKMSKSLPEGNSQGGNHHM